jgi:hypothetical protein
MQAMDCYHTGKILHWSRGASLGGLAITFSLASAFIVANISTRNVSNLSTQIFRKNLGLAGSSLLLASGISIALLPGGFLASWIRSGITRFYNQRYGTNVSKTDLMAHQFAEMIPFEKQLLVIANISISLTLNYYRSLVDAETSQLQQNTSSSSATAAEIAVFQKMEQHKETIKTYWVSSLQRNKPEMFNKIKQMQLHMMENQNNGPLNNELLEFTREILLSPELTHILENRKE